MQPRHHARPVNLGRHKRNCSVCSHPQQAEIEADFISWRSPAVIAREYGLADRTSVYRHAHALNLFAKRQRTATLPDADIPGPKRGMGISIIGDSRPSLFPHS
jgi:hypothetical protein